VLLAARAPARTEYAGVVRYLSIQIRKLGVDVRFGLEATPSLVLAERVMLSSSRPGRILTSAESRAATASTS